MKKAKKADIRSFWKDLHFVLKKRKEAVLETKGTRTVAFSNNWRRNTFKGEGVSLCQLVLKGTGDEINDNYEVMFE